MERGKMAERMWCTACGTVTSDQFCDCNRYGVGHEMYREPNFVNYADAMQEAAHEQAQRVAVLERALEIIAHDAYRDPRQIALEALAPVGPSPPRAPSPQLPESAGDPTGGGE